MRSSTLASGVAAFAAAVEAVDVDAVGAAPDDTGPLGFVASAEPCGDAVGVCAKTGPAANSMAASMTRFFKTKSSTT